MTIFVIVGVTIIISFLPCILPNFPRAELSSAVFADVTSANVVGYMNKTSNSGTGYTMLCPNFLGVGAEKPGCKLSELSVTGYTGMSAGNFMLEPLTASGTADGGQYYWVDIPVAGKKGWFKNQQGTIEIPGGAESVFFDAGRGLWCQGKGLTLVFSGEVNEKLVSFPSNSGTGYTAMGNCFPVDITLDKLTVTGYTGMSAGNFMLELLTPSGTADGGAYYWVDIPVAGKKGWFKNQQGSQEIPGGAASVTITAGRGVWCQGKGLTLNIPAPVLNK